MLARLQVNKSWHAPPSSLLSELLSSTSAGWCDATAPWSVSPHANGLAYGMTNRPTANAAISEPPTRPDLIMLNSRRVGVNVRSSHYEDFITRGTMYEREPGSRMTTERYKVTEEVPRRFDKPGPAV